VSRRESTFVVAHFSENSMKIATTLNGVLNRFGYRISRKPEPRMPVEATARDIEILRLVSEYTMTTPERIWALISAVRYVTGHVPGDFVECGVWRGGSAMVMAYSLLDMGIRDKKLWLYDTFQGMTQPSLEDVELSSGENAETLLRASEKSDKERDIWCFSPLAAVAANLQKTGYPAEQVKLVKGDVLQTLHVDTPDLISLLRLDTDWYASTKEELEVLYPKLHSGGVCIIDDYGYWGGSKKAVDEYLESNGIRVLLQRIDDTGRMFIKP
jgi:O-methyltransferase